MLKSIAKAPRLAASRRQKELRPASFPCRSLAAALSGESVSIIAEFKKQSPGSGFLNRNLEEQIAAYRRGGAAAISVLTEEEHFSGSPKDLLPARKKTSLPILQNEDLEKWLAENGSAHLIENL